MILKAARFVNLLLAALLAGNEFGTWVAVHPALGAMPTPAHVRAEQELVRCHVVVRARLDRSEGR